MYGIQTMEEWLLIHLKICSQKVEFQLDYYPWMNIFKIIISMVWLYVFVKIMNYLLLMFLLW